MATGLRERESSEFRPVVNLLIAVHHLLICTLTLFSVEDILLPKYVNWSNNFRGLTFNEDMAPRTLFQDPHFSNVTTIANWYFVHLWMGMWFSVCVWVCVCMYWLVGFYYISTLVGYVMPDPIYAYIKYMIRKLINCWQHFKQARAYLFAPC